MTLASEAIADVQRQKGIGKRHSSLVEKRTEPLLNQFRLIEGEVLNQGIRNQETKKLLPLAK